MGRGDQVGALFAFARGGDSQPQLGQKYDVRAAMGDEGKG